ncbi:MAG TPA: class I SAM-dependent methyltransferase [Armatimonadota bacterium]|nr:class I SAM-dependent methyltransferase [Armatimonadota bacterium]
MDNNTQLAQFRFNHAAATWDENPGRLLAANNTVSAILTQVPVRSDMTVIDYGCGTGLVTLGLQPYVERIIGVDISPAMLTELENKVRALALSNVETCCLDLRSQPSADLHADLVVSAMALHHIADIPSALRALTGLLSPGGYVALADLDVEDGSFHGDKTGVFHYGIDRTWLIAQLEALGIQEIQSTTAHVVERPAADGNHRYPVFLISGRLTG